MRDETDEHDAFALFATRFHKKYQPVVQECMDLVRIGNVLFRRPLTEPLHKVIRFIAKIVANSNGAVLTLNENGYGNDAMKVARSMFDGAVTSAYLRLHPDSVEDYLNYDSIRRWRFYEYMVSDSPEYLGRIPKDALEAMKQEYEQVAPGFMRRNNKLWDSWRRGVSLHAMSKEVGLGQFYVPFYGTASGIHHMDASGMRGQMTFDAFDVEVAPSDRYVHEALAMSHNLTWRVLYDFNEEARLGMHAEMEAARKGLMTAWEVVRQ